MVLQTSPQQKGAGAGRFAVAQQSAQAPTVPLSQGGKKTSSDVVEIIDDDDDIVIVSSTPPTARKSTGSKSQGRSPQVPKTQLVVQAPSRAQSAQAATSPTPSNEQEYDPTMMEGEDLMYIDDDATWVYFQSP